MNKRNYNMDIGETAACTKSIMEEINGLGQRDAKGATNDLFIYENLFS